MSSVDLKDANGAIFRPDTFSRDEGGNIVHMQAVVPVDSITGTPLEIATQTTLAALKSVVDSLLTSAQAIEVAAEAINGKTTAVNTGAIGGTVALDAPTLMALETINASTGGLTNSELRASAVPVAMQSYSSVTIMSATTDAAGTGWVDFATQACTSLDIVNASNTTIEYRRNGAGVGMPIPSRSSREAVGITNADQISVRRVDQLTDQVTVYAEAMQ